MKTAQTLIAIAIASVLGPLPALAYFPGPGGCLGPLFPAPSVAMSAAEMNVFMHQIAQRKMPRASRWEGVVGAQAPATPNSPKDTKDTKDTKDVNSPVIIP